MYVTKLYVGEKKWRQCNCQLDCLENQCDTGRKMILCLLLVPTDGEKGFIFQGKGVVIFESQIEI